LDCPKGVEKIASQRAVKERASVESGVSGRRGGERGGKTARKRGVSPALKKKESKKTFWRRGNQEEQEGVKKRKIKTRVSGHAKRFPILSSKRKGQRGTQTRFKTVKENSSG